VVAANDHCCKGCADNAHGPALAHCLDGQGHACCSILPIAAGLVMPHVGRTTIPSSLVPLYSLLRGPPSRPPRITVAA
jgi:hypothetical protein